MDDKKLIRLIKNYGNRCEWVGYHEGLEEDDPLRVSCEKSRDEKYDEIIRHLSQPPVEADESVERCVGNLIDSLGNSFRGLWKSYELNDDDTVDDKWCVTFIYKNQYVETPLFRTAEEALRWACDKSGLQPTNPADGKNCDGCGRDENYCLCDAFKSRTA